MRYVSLILLLLLSNYCSAQIIYSWGSPTGRDQAKGIFQPDSGIKFVPRILGPFRYTGDSLCVLQVSLTDSSLYYTKDGITWTKLATISPDSTGGYYINGGNSFGVPGRLGTKDNHSLHFITNNIDRGYIDSVGNIFIGANGYVPKGVNNTSLGIKDTLRVQSSTSQGNSIIGSIMQIGDSTTDMQFCRFIGTRNKILNNSFSMNYYHTFGPNITVYQKSNSNVPTVTIGSSIMDSVNNNGQDYGNILFGYQLTNDGKKSVTVIGKKGNHNVTTTYHTQKDNESVLLSTGEWRFYTGGKDNAVVISDTNGNLLLNKAQQSSTDTFRLDVNGNAKFATNVTIGTNLKLSSFKNGSVNQKVFTTDTAGNLVFIPVDTTFDPHGLTLADFGITPIFKRTWLSHKSGNDTITSAPGTFDSTSVGQVIYIPRAKQLLGYSTDTIGVTGTITAFINTSTVLVDSTPTFTLIDSTGYFFRNWYDSMQYVADYLASHQVGEITADGAGVYGLCPKLSRRAATQLPATRGIQITYPLSIRGSGSNITYFKLSLEDDIHINTSENYQSSLFVDYTHGGFQLTDMTLLAPDRSCLSFTPADSSGAAVNVPSDLNKHGSTVLRNVRIIGDSSGKKPYWQLSWPNAVQVSTTDTIGQYTLDIENAVLQSSYQNITYFTPRGGKKSLYMNHVKTYNSGSPLMGTLFVNAATISNGSPTLTLHSTPSNPNPSWYKFTSLIGLSRLYTIYLYNGTDTFSARMLTVVNDTVVTLDRNATHAFTLANMQSKGVQNLGFGEGQNVYVHPTIIPYVNDIEVLDAYELAWQCYSSHGNLPGQADSRTYIGCRSTVGPMGYTDMGWLLGNGNKIPNTLVNCDFQIYSLGHTMQIKAYNCNFRNLSPFYDTSSVYNCSGSMYVIGSPMQMNVYGGNYSNIYIHQQDSGTTNIYGDSVTLIANNSVHNGVVNVMGGTIVGLATGVGSVVYPQIQKDTTTWDATKANITTQLANYVPTTRTVNGKSLSSNIILGLASSDFNNQGTTTTVLHGNASGNPSFGAINLATDITGTLPSANFNYAANQNVQSGTTYTLVSGDNGKTIYFTNASAITLTIPSGLPTGFNCLIHQSGAGQVTITNGSGVTGANRQSFTKTSGTRAIATIVNTTTTDDYTWSGDMSN